LNHTSGLARHSQHYDDSELASIPPIDETIRRYAISVKPAGESFEYSNVGYAILNRIVETASGRPFAEYIKSEIFDPLGMKNTSYGNRTQGIATGYSGEQVPTRRVPRREEIYSSVDDLLLFGRFMLGDQAHIRGSFLSAGSRAEMLRPAADRGRTKYGLGMESVQTGKYTRVFHDGSNGYGMSIFLLIPEKGICISILSNMTWNGVVPLVDEILSALIPDYAENVAAFRSAARQDESTPYRPTEEFVGNWKGSIHTWKESIPVEMWFKPDGDIHIQMRGQYRSLLNGARIEEGFLRGSFQSNIGTDDARRFPYNLHLRLKMRNRRLSGSITASSTIPQGNVLSYWIELEKPT
jgi:CubicO group peptidase (beta-lactamase class C family)